jgi:hypothetical protein
MLNYLYQRDPQLDIWCEDIYERSPLVNAIIYSPRLLELLQVIKSNETTHTKITIRTNYNVYNTHRLLSISIYKYVADSDKSTICTLVGLYGDLFHLIPIKYLTQDICTEAMSSLAKSILFK